MNEHVSLSSAVLLTPRYAGLVAGRDNIVDVLVRVQAPDAPRGAPAVRSHQALALVIDRSGSMSGRPLAEARRCAEFVVSRLRPVDTVALVQFDNRIDRLWPAVPLGDGDSVRAAIGRIAAGGNTNLHGGWLDGADSLSALSSAGLKRVVLLSDGCANEGVTSDAEIAAQCSAWAQKGITTSTYGLGNSFNEEVMVVMARAGGGNHYYGDTAEDLIEPFQQELDLIANLCLGQVALTASAPDGVAVEMLNDLRATEAGWQLPDLAWGAEAWALLRVRVPAGALPAIGDRMTVLRVAVTGLDMDGIPVALEKTGLALPVMSAHTFDALASSELVQRRGVEVEAGRSLTKMRAAAQSRDWAEVQRLLADAQERFAGNEWVAEMLKSMADVARSRSRERMMKEAMYSSSRLNTRLAAKDELNLRSNEDELAAYMRRKPLQGKKDL